MLTGDEDLAAIRAQLAAAQRSWGEHGETVVDTGLTYVAKDPVRIHVRKRGRSYDLSDDGAAIVRAGRRSGWLDTVDRWLAAEGFNANRRGVVFVPVYEGRDLASLVLRLGEASRSAFVGLLELQADETE